MTPMQNRIKDHISDTARDIQKMLDLGERGKAADALAAMSPLLAAAVGIRLAYITTFTSTFTPTLIARLEADGMAIAPDSMIET